MTAKARRPPIGRSRMPTTKATTRINHHWPNPSSPPPFDSNGRSRRIHHEGSIFPSNPIVPDPRSDVDSGDTQVFLLAIIRPLMDAPDDDDADRRQGEWTDSSTSSGQQRLHPRRLRWAANGGERAKDGRWTEAARRTDTRQMTGLGSCRLDGRASRLDGRPAVAGGLRASLETLMRFRRAGSERGRRASSGWTGRMACGRGRELVAGVARWTGRMACGRGRGQVGTLVATEDGFGRGRRTRTGHTGQQLHSLPLTGH